MRRRQLSNLIFLIIFLFGISFSLSAQGMRGGEIPFEMDVAQFHAGDGWSYLEVYFSMSRSGISHVQTGSRFEGRLETNIRIMKVDSVLNEKKDTLVDPVDDLKELEAGLRVFNVYSFYLKPGVYKIRFQSTDLNTGQSGWIERPLSVSAFSDDSLTLSDIQLASQIRPDTTRSAFLKNGYTVIPNASAIYGIEQPILYYYMEIYGLSPLAAGRDSIYTVLATIEDTDGKTVKRDAFKQKIRRGASLLDVGKLHVAGLRSGTYKLVLAVTDSGVAKSVTAEKPFVVYRRADFASNETNSASTPASFASEFDGMTDEELDANFKYCDFLATSQEKKTFKKLDLGSKRQFLKDFWQKRDENPMTAVNETKIAYFARINQSNQRFGTASKEGWKTDQGRVLIVYGEPDEIERFPGDMSGRYYEIWHYYKLEGGAIFVFVDIQNYGKLQLVHSTLTRETHDYDWEKWLN
ncbi:GWxTD domain-containing protein [bacterium]|nr:MAG: GWxTD domain-containing protein [bacterium]